MDDSTKKMLAIGAGVSVLAIGGYFMLRGRKSVSNLLSGDDETKTIRRTETVQDKNDLDWDVVYIDQKIPGGRQLLWRATYSGPKNKVYKTPPTLDGFGAEKAALDAINKWVKKAEDAATLSSMMPWGNAL